MADDFDLEPDVDPGTLPERVVDELRVAYRTAKDYSGSLRDALKAQADKHAIAPAALRRYIAALEGDTLADARKEAEDLERLIEAKAA